MIKKDFYAWACVYKTINILCILYMSKCDFKLDKSKGGNLMKKFNKIVALIVVLSIFSTLAIGCGSKNATSSANTQKSSLDTSKKVELNIYLMGDPAKDNDAILKELNKLTEKDLNATVKITYSTWTDFSTKYNLMLTSGENMDLVYAANWLSYATYAKKGAFLDLTNLIPKYAPKLEKLISKERWDAVKVDGKIYAVPNNNIEFTQGAFLYREDLREKYNLPEINSVDTIEQYLAGIKKNDPNIMPTDDSGCAAYNNLFIYTTPYEIVDRGDEGTSNLVIDPKNPYKVLETIETPEYKSFMYKMKSWADQGFWSKSALSKNEDGVVAFENGTAAATFNSTLAKAKGEIEKLKITHPDWKIGVFEYNRLMPNKVHAASATQNLTAIPATSKNPERALALLEKLMTDRRYYDLMQYGIKGVSYNMTADGKIDFTKIDPNKHGAPSSWAWRNDLLTYQQVGEWDQWRNYVEEDKKLATVDILDGFALDTDPVQNEVAAVNQVKNQYGVPLQAGLAVGDVDTAYNTFLSKSKSAGLDKYRDEVQKQLDAYLKEKGIK